MLNHTDRTLIGWPELSHPFGLAPQVSLNGNAMTPDLYREHCMHIDHQASSLFSCLTTIEHVYYAASLFNGAYSYDDSMWQVDRILAATTLLDCRHILVGNPSHREHLSTGQRRRLALALALAKRPSVLVADGPTMGLDAVSAAAIMQLLGKLARSMQTAVVCTLDQPAASVLAGVDTLLLLAKGRVAYYGTAAELGPYLASLGMAVPAGVSVGEYALELVNAETYSETHVESLLQAWRATHPPDAPLVVAELVSVTKRPDFQQRVATMLHLQGTMMIRDHRLLGGKVASSFLPALFYALFYLHARHREQVG